MNATAAARAAGYAGTEAVLAVTASRLLRIAKVRDAIRELSGEAVAKAYGERAGAIADLAEALEFATTTMRTRLGDFLTAEGEVDLGKVRSAPAGVVKKLRVTTTTDAEGQVFARHDIETESALSAAQTLIKHYDGLEGEARPKGALAKILLEQLAPATVAAIARAMLSGNGAHRLGNGKPIDVKGKVLG